MRMPGVRALPLSVRATVGLLLIGAFLVVLGLFNQYLAWDIFSPRLEKILWGVFASSLALGGFGFAITLVLGVQEVVSALRRSAPGGEAAVAPKAAKWGQLFWLGVVFGVLALTVLGLDRLNAGISTGRIAVFKRLAQSEIARLETPLRSALARVSRCAGCRSPELGELLAALRRQACCAEATLYLPDGDDTAHLWSYAGRAPWEKEDAGFERVVVSTDVERAIALALRGDGAWIAQKNAGSDFTWNAVLAQPEAGTALLRVLGNPRASYRDAAEPAP